MKAFLAHSHDNRAFVHAVAERVGRPLVVLDEYDFEKGKTFRQLMQEHLLKSDVFVLFASTTALESKNVLFEVSEAEKLQTAGRLDRVLVFVIDEDVPYSSLPPWLTQFNAMKTSSANQCAREILLLYKERSANRLVFGRTQEVARLEHLLTPVDGSISPRSFSVFGYPGVGRRTVVAEAASKIWRMPKLAIVPVGVGDDLRETRLLLAEEVGAIHTDDELTKLLSEQPRSETLTRDCVNHIRTLSAQRTLPVFIDEGGLITESGEMTRPFSRLLEVVSDEAEAYLAIVSRRLMVEASAGSRLPQLRVQALQTADMTRLLKRLAEIQGADISPAQLGSLAEYVAGYPPAAQYAIRLIRSYGVGMVLNDQENLVQFRVSIFLRLLERDRQLTSERKKALATLLLYGPIPISVVIAAGMGIAIGAMGEHFSYLLDSALVEVDDATGFYQISRPLTEAVDRVVDEQAVDHGRVRDALTKEVASQQDGEPKLTLRRRLLRAKLMTGESVSVGAAAFASDLFAIAKRAYDERKYEDSYKFINQALIGREDTLDFLRLKTRACIRLERDDEARDVIQIIEAAGYLQAAYFLTGFLYRTSKVFDKAVEYYLQALNRGLNDVAIHRELADAYFRLRNIADAEFHIDQAQRRDRDNRYIVDLQIQIACAAGAEDTARSRLKILELVDKKPYYFHRKAVVEFRFGKLPQAYADAKSGIRLMARPPMEHVAYLALLQIECRHLDEAAESLKALRRSTRRIDRDRQRVLEARWESASGNFDGALSLLGSSAFGDARAWRYARYEALKASIATVGEQDPRISAFREEVESLGRQDRDLIASVDDDDFEDA